MKRALIAAFVLALVFSFSANASVALNGAQAALVSEDGQTIVPPGTYAQIIPLDGSGFFAVMDENGRFGLIDGAGNLKTSVDYAFFEAADGAVLYEKDGKYGALDVSLEPLVPCEYTWLVPNGEGGFLAHTTDVWDDYPDGVYLIDATGYVSPTGVKVASLLTGFSSGLSPALSTDKGRYGYLNPEGQWEIRPQYAYAEPFEGGYAVATLDSGCGVIDTNGAWKISPKYDYIAVIPGEKEIVCVSYAREIDVYDADSFECVINVPVLGEGAYATVGNGMLVIYDTEKVIAVNAEGKTVLTAPPDALIISAAGNRMILLQGGWDRQSACLVDRNGIQTSKTYPSVSYLGLFGGIGCYVTREFTVSESGEWDAESIRCGVIDEDDREILPMKYSTVTSPENGWILAESDEGMELYGSDGQMVWSCK